MRHTCKHDPETLRQLQALSLKAKVFESRQRIAEWVEHWGADKVYVAFSGGKDSTVLLDLVRRDYPDIPAVFFDTGLEFPEIREFVRSFSAVTWLKPEKTFKRVIEEHGYPVVSKKQVDMIERLRSYPATEANAKTRTLYLTGINSKGERSRGFKISEKWKKLLDAPFRVSGRCCDVMKKRPANAYVRATGKLPITGEMAADSQTRRGAYLQQGCNAFESKHPKSTPLAFWNESDIWDYLRTKNIPYSKIYDMGYARTGCMFCAFGAHMEKSPNRFQRMQHTHPAQWSYCMHQLGMREVLEFVGIEYEWNPEQ